MCYMHLQWLQGNHTVTPSKINLARIIAYYIYNMVMVKTSGFTGPESTVFMQICKYCSSPAKCCKDK